MFAFVEGVVKKVLANVEKCWHMLMQLLKSVCKLRRVLAFPEGAVKKVFKYLISVVKLRKVLAYTEGAVKKVFVSLEMCWHLLREL